MPLILALSLLLPVVGEAASLTMNASSTVSVPGFIPHVLVSDNERSIFSIVWSCVATIFACAWVAVHPDVPELDDDGFSHFFHRMKLLVWFLISPETVLVWAWRQHRGAQALRYMFNQPSGNNAHSKNWNLGHAHFLQMGGFVICRDKKDERCKFFASPEQLKTLAEKGIIDFPEEVTPRDIEDKSKDDWFTHFVAIGQLLWFVTQCVVRTVAGLSVTLFELVAASFVPLTIIMYVLWWKKPQNAQAPLVIMVKPDKPDSKSESEKRPLVPLEPEPGPEQSPVKPLRFPLSYIQQAINTFEDMLGTTHRSQSFPPRGRRLPPFYAYPHEHDPSKIPKTPLIAGSVLGTIFGVIHILGWSFKFATRIEKLLWCASSVIIIVVPLLTVLNIFSARKNLHRKASRVAGGEADVTNSGISEVQTTSVGHIFLQAWYAFVAAVLTLGYISARLILLGVMCSSLRALPAKQTRAFKWVTDIPHII